MKHYSYVRGIFLLYLLFSFTSCAKLKPEESIYKGNILQRGWSFIESSAELAEADAGSTEINFTSGLLLGQKILYGSVRFGLVVLNKDSGRVYWRKQWPGGVHSDLLVQKEKIFLGGGDGVFRALSIENGNEIWQKSFSFPVVGKPIFVDGRVLVGTIDSALHCLDAITGKEIWTYRRGAIANTAIKGGGNPAYIGGKIWVGFSDGALVALEPNDGSVLIEKQFHDNPKFTDIKAAPIGWKNGIFVSSYDGKLRYLKKDGSVEWAFPAGGAHPPLITNLYGGTIFFPSSDGTVYSIQDSTAKESWRFNVKSGIPTGIAIVEKNKKSILIVASSDNYIYALDAKTGKLLEEIKLGSSSGTYAELIADKEQVFVVSHYGRIHELKL